MNGRLKPKFMLQITRDCSTLRLPTINGYATTITNVCPANLRPPLVIFAITKGLKEIMSIHINEDYL